MIQEDWVKNTIHTPDLIEEKRDDEKHYLKQIQKKCGEIPAGNRQPLCPSTPGDYGVLSQESAAMKVTVDKEADALYMRLSDTHIHDSEEVKPGVILDYDEQNNLVGIEILRISERVPSASLKTVMIESA